MSELPDTPMLGRAWCPGCEPDADPTREILDTRPCHQHQAAPGVDDARLASDRYLSGSTEAGADGAAWAEALHRRRHLLRGPA